MRRCGFARSCIDLGGGCFLVDGLFAQVVTAFVFLLHAVDQEKDEEDGEEQANGTAGNDGCEKEKNIASKKNA